MRQRDVAVVVRTNELRHGVARAFDRAPAQWNVTLHRDPPPDANVVIAERGCVARADVWLAPDNLDGIVDAVAAVIDHHAGRVIGFVGTGGGVGVTSVALHVAAAMRSECCLIDLDERARGVGLRLGLPATTPSWADLEDQPESLLQCALPVAGGFRVLLGPTDGPSIVPHEAFAIAGARFEQVLVDVAGQDLGDVLARCRLAVLVTTPTLPSMGRAKQLVDIVEDVPVAIVTNRLGPGSDATRSALEAELGRRIALQLPCSAMLRDREDQAALLKTPFSRWYRGIQRLARTIENQ
jgi:Flp pilus assembly CpaE family ATPase